MRTIYLESLKIFRAVVDEGGIVRAANRVQFNVTTRIRQLEEHLGTRLFRRGGALTSKLEFTSSLGFVACSTRCRTVARSIPGRAHVEASRQAEGTEIDLGVDRVIGRQRDLDARGPAGHEVLGARTAGPRSFPSESMSKE
jgi:hypothetical protein